MKKIFIFILAFLMSFNAICSSPVFANTINSDTTTSYTFYDDGSYMVTRITEEPTTIATHASSTTTKSKISSYYSNNNVELWYVKVTGTFTYNGTTSKCTDSRITAASYSSAWKISNKSASKSGPSATAKATANFYNGSRIDKTINKSVTLTCSAKGTFS